MSKLVSIQWSHQRLLVVGGTPGGGSIQVNQAFTVELPADQESEQSINDAVAASFRANGIGRADAIIVLDRDCVEIRQFDVPPVPSEELPDLVRFQANTQFTSFNDNWALDYVPVGFDKDRQATSVLACALSPQLLGQIRECLDTVNLKIRHITVRGFTSISLVKPQPGDGEQIIVQQVGDEIDLTAMESNNILLTRTVKLPSHDDREQLTRKVTQEFKRTLASCSNQHSRNNFEYVRIVGLESDRELIAEAIAKATDAKIEFIDPAKLTQWGPSESADDYGPAVASLIAKGNNVKYVVDLLNPRSRPRENKGTNRAMIFGGIAAAVVVVMFVAAYWFLNSQHQQLQALEKDLEKLKQQNEPAEVILGEVEKIDQWKKADVNLLDELAAISNQLPLGDDAMIDNLNGSYQLTTKNFKMNLDGRISDAELSRSIDQSLRTAGYEVDAGADLVRLNDAAYKRDFKKVLEIILADREIEEYETEAETTDEADGDSKDLKENKKESGKTDKP